MKESKLLSPHLLTFSQLQEKVIGTQHNLEIEKGFPYTNIRIVTTHGSKARIAYISEEQPKEFHICILHANSVSNIEHPVMLELLELITTYAYTPLKYRKGRDK